MPDGFDRACFMRIVGAEMADRRYPLTQRELSAKVGIDHHTLSEIERGETMPKLDVFVRLVEACPGVEDPDEALWSAVWEYHYRRDEPTSKRDRETERERRAIGR